MSITGTKPEPDSAPSNTQTCGGVCYTALCSAHAIISDVTKREKSCSKAPIQIKFQKNMMYNNAQAEM